MISCKAIRTIKKILALGMGITLLGSTLLGTAAAGQDISDYPAQFMEDGMFNGIIVVGDDAGPTDIISITDIATDLQYSSTVEETVRVTTRTDIAAKGDSVKTQRIGDRLEINEYIGDVTETIDASDALALQSYKVSNEKGSTQVNQYLRFNWGTGATTADMTVAKAIYGQDDDDNVGDFLWFKDGEEAFQYELEFEEGLESSIETTDNTLPDLEDETIKILGEDFSITEAQWLPSTTGLTIELMGGAVHDLLGEGETKTYSIKGKEYEVTVAIISDWSGATGNPKVKMIVNGKSTQEMTAGSTEILTDGTNLGIRSVLPNEAGETGGGDLVEFYLGASKIELSDAYAADTWDGTVAVNSENIEDADLLITYTNTSDTVKIEKISYRLFTDTESGDDAYITKGNGYRETLDEPEGMLAGSWDFRYEGLSNPGTSEIKVRASGDDEYMLSFTNTQGIEYSNVRLMYSNSTGLYYGDEEDALIFNQGTNTTEAANYNIKKDDYFVLAHNGGTDTGVTRVLRLDSVDTANSLVQLTDIGTDSTINALFTGTIVTCADGTAGSLGEINVGGYTFDFRACNSSASGKGQIQLLVDLDDDGTLGGEGKIVTQGGGMIDLGTETEATWRPAVGSNMTISTDNNNFDEAPAADETLYVSFFLTSSDEVDLDVADNTTIGLTMYTSEDDDDLKTGMTNYGLLIEESEDSNDPDSLMIEYPLEQLIPQVFTTFEQFFSIDDSQGVITINTPIRMDIDYTPIANRLIDLDSTNVISVGGPCVNSITAEIMGLDYPSCGEESGLSEGEGIIKLYENGDKVALVVAGWEAEDTIRATRTLINPRAHEDSGSAVKVTKNSATDYIVTPVD